MPIFYLNEVVKVQVSDTTMLHNVSAAGFKKIFIKHANLARLLAKNCLLNYLRNTVYYYSLLKFIAMIIVHDIFICKPGNASKFAKMCKEAMGSNAEMVNILTDMTGEFNKVVMVTKYDNLAAYEQNFEKYMHDSEEMKKMKEIMKDYHEMYLTGSREIYRVW